MKVPFYIFFSLFPFFCVAQVNLVRNGSFEDHSNCPFIDDQVSFCDFWQKANGCTTDYVCSCAPAGSGFQAPYFGYAGFQQPFHGGCYMGLYGYGDMGNGQDLLVSEFIQTELTDSLKLLHTYRLTMYVNLSNYAEFTIHNFGAFISSVKPDDGVWCDTFSTYHPQLIVAYLTDTLNWVKQEVEFIAQGGEKWLTIGRFDFDGPSQLLAVTPDTTPFSPIRYAYYMVDSVSLIDITDPENLPNIQNVISPNHDGINDVFALPEYDFLFGEKVTIYSRWGNEVAILDSSNTYWNGLDQSGQNVSEGSYFFIFSATTKEGKTIYKKGTLSVFR